MYLAKIISTSQKAAVLFLQPVFCVTCKIYLSHFLAQNICQPHATKLDTFIRRDFSLNQFQTQARPGPTLTIFTQFDQAVIRNKNL